MVSKGGRNESNKNSGHGKCQESSFDGTEDFVPDEGGQGCLKELHIVRSNQSGDTVEDYVPS